ncbi:MAG: tetratricopeptide repeat protein [Polaromonas sp.]|nr:tetratricopeptide repeat protein [Polaromonas sp.]
MNINQYHAAFTKMPESAWPFVRMAAWAGVVAMTVTDATAQEVAQGTAPAAASTAVSAPDPSAELTAARAAWEAGSTDVRVPERLIEFLKANRQPSQAIVVAEQAYQRLGDARWLLLAMNTALGASLSQELRRLIGIAKRNEDKFAGVESYWLLNAYVASEDRDRPAARAAYNQALAINPSSVATRTQILWFEIDGNEKESLGRHLQQWQRDAESDPAFWTPYAVGLVKVNRPDESIPWYERQVAAKPDDILWQLSYAYVLSEAGRPAEAQGLRRGILQRLKDNPGVIDKLSTADRRSLMLAHASMAHDFEGAAAGDLVLRDMVARGYRDADVYSQLVASSLAMEDIDGAYQWLLKAEAEGHTLPAYQVLAVAFGRNDRAMMAKLLQERSEELSVTDRVTALRRVGRPVDALALVDSSLPQAGEETGRQLRQQRYEIVSEQARRVEIRYENRNISELDMARTEVSGSQPMPWGRTTVRLARNSLRSDIDSPNLTFSRDENDLSVMAELMASGDPLRVTLGTNQRSDVSFTYGSAEWSHNLTKGVRARVEAAVNALTEESAAMRAVGKKDKLSFGLSGNPSSMTNARVEFASQRYQTRKGDALGRGTHLEGEIGAVVLQGSPTWHVRLSGSADRNQLAASLPPDLVGTVLSPFSTVESLISKRFSTLGAGSTLRIGQADGPGRGANGFVDVWVGRQWPANELAYSLRVAAALPVRSAGEFKLEGYYTNVQSSVTGSGKSSRGIAVGYRHEF